jgi:hypothetical protein
MTATGGRGRATRPIATGTTMASGMFPTLERRMLLPDSRRRSAPNPNHYSLVRSWQFYWPSNWTQRPMHTHRYHGEVGRCAGATKEDSRWAAMVWSALQASFQQRCRGSGNRSRCRIRGLVGFSVEEHHLNQAAELVWFP